MPQSMQVNRAIVLASRPDGPPSPANFRLMESPLPAPAEGQVLLRTVYLSLDPYMRGRMSDAPSYAPHVELDAVMVGQTVSRVMESKHPDFQPGDWVLASGGWQDYAAVDAGGLRHLGKAPAQPSYALGVAGMPGFTAYIGVLEIGQPKAGETLVVGAATGPVGATAGQLGKRAGCRVVGIAGGADKCRHAVEVLGFDVCIDHRAEDFARQLAAACPAGIDIYVENVGGKVFDAVLPLLNVAARVPVIGLIAQYSGAAPSATDRLPALMSAVLRKRLKVQGLIIFDYYATPRYADFLRDIPAWLADGTLKYTEDVVDGLENTPSAFVGLLEGRNFGKLVVKVGADD